MTYRAVKTLFALASIVLIPAPASAQFTTLIVPPPKAKVDSAKAVIAAAQTAHDEGRDESDQYRSRHAKKAPDRGAGGRSDRHGSGDATQRHDEAGSPEQCT